jgi:hypothetical protein
MKGWVYIITTKSMPDLVKVGFSTKDPEMRAAELNNTGNPYPYKVEYEVLVNEPRNVEQIAHRLLKNKGLHENKEWFNCSIEIAITEIRNASKNTIILENIYSKNSLKEMDLDDLLKWADKNNIDDYYFEDEIWYGFPRNKQKILAITDLNLNGNKLTELPKSIESECVVFRWKSIRDIP